MKRMNILKLLSLLLSLLLFVLPLASCGGSGGNDDNGDDGTIDTRTDEEKIEDRIDAFLDDYNANDMDALINSFDQETRLIVNTLLGIMGALSDEPLDLNELFEFSIDTEPGDFQDFSIKQIEFHDTRNTAKATAEIQIGDLGVMVIFFDLVKEENDWFIKEMEEEAILEEEPSNEDTEPEDTTPRLMISGISSFVDGCAFVNYYYSNDPDTTYDGLINSDGLIYFEVDQYAPDANLQYFPIGNGAYIFKSWFATEGICFVVNRHGEVIADNRDGSFDGIDGYGDGQVLIFKYLPNYDTVRGVLESDGNWLVPMQETPSPVSGSSLIDKYHPIGGGVFQDHEYSSYFSPAFNISYWISGAELATDIANADGKIYGVPKDSSGAYINRSDDTKDYMFAPFCVNPDGSVVTLTEEEFDALPRITEMTYQQDTDGLKIFDENGDLTGVYTEIASEDIGRIEKWGNYIAIFCYDDSQELPSTLTVINKYAEKVLNSIQCDYAEYLDEDRFSYTDGTYYALLDMQGNTLISLDAGYTSIGHFSGGVARFVKGETYGGLDLDGKEIAPHLPE